MSITEFVEASVLGLREDGTKISDIAETLDLTERAVQAVMRKHGLCRDQRPMHEYAVTVLLPETILVQAQSVGLARAQVSARYNDNVRVTAVDILDGGGS